MYSQEFLSYIISNVPALKYRTEDGRLISSVCFGGLFAWAHTSEAFRLPLCASALKLIFIA